MLKRFILSSMAWALISAQAIPALAQDTFNAPPQAQQKYDIAFYNALKTSLSDLNTGGTGATLPATDLRPNMQLSSQWTWSPMHLSGPNQSEDGKYSLSLVADLVLSVTIESAESESVEHTHRWPISRDIPIANIDQLLALVKQVTGKDADISNDAGKAEVIAVLEQVPSFQKMLSQNPAETLGGEAETVLKQESFVAIADKIQESIKSKTKTPRPSEAQTSGEPLGIGIGIRGGTVPFWQNAFGQFGIQFDKYFVPQFQLDLEYDLTRVTGFDNLSVTLSGGSTMPQFHNSPQFIQTQFGSAMGINGELGLMYRWPFEPFDFHLGLRGGVLAGMLTVQQVSFVPSPPMMAFSFGGTLLAGMQWNITPQFATGIDLGGRFFADSFWTDQFGFPQPSIAPALSSVGPVIQIYTSYTL